MPDLFTFQDESKSYARYRIYKIPSRPNARITVEQCKSIRSGEWEAAEVSWSAPSAATREMAEETAAALLHAAQTARQWDIEKGISE